MLYNSIWLKRFTSLKSDEIFKWILWMCDMMWEYSASGRFLVAYDSASWLVTVVDDISGSLFAFTFQLVICTPLPCVYLGTAMRVHSRRHLLLRPTRSYLNFIYPLVYDETIICSKKINTAFDSIPTTVESTRRRARLVLHSIFLSLLSFFLFFDSCTCSLERIAVLYPRRTAASFRGSFA